MGSLPFSENSATRALFEWAPSLSVQPGARCYAGNNYTTFASRKLAIWSKL